MKQAWATPFVEGFEDAFTGLKKDYQKAPFIYLNKWDVVSDLYSRMKGKFEAKDVETGRYTIGKDGRWRQKKFRTTKIKTSPLHLAMGFEMSDRPRADICYIDLSSMQFAVTARFSKKKPTSVSSWRFSSGGAVSVVKNSDVQYARRRNKSTGRYSRTEGMKELERMILKEINGLGDWDKTVLLLVDDHGLYTKHELENTFSKKLKPYTMKFYYLSPKAGFFITGKRRSGKEGE